MFIRIFSTTYYLPLHHRNWFSPIFFSWTRLPEAASYVGFTAGGFHACDKLFWSCPQLFSHGVTCIHPSTCDSHFALEAKTERVTRDVFEYIDDSPLGHEWVSKTFWVLWEKAWLGQIQQVNAGNCVMLHVLKEHSIQPPAAQAFTMFLTKTCFPFPACIIKTTCYCEDDGGFCFLLLINQFLCPGFLL